MSTILNSKTHTSTLYHDAVNFSTAQQKFSFSKGRRFSLMKPNTPTDFTVNLPSAFGRRSPSFGVGNRFSTPVPRSMRKCLCFC